MTKPTDTNSAQPGFRGYILRWVQIAVAFLLAIFLLGVTVGSTVTLMEGEVIRLKPALVSLGSLAACIACGWWLWSLKPFATSDEPVSPRTRASRRYMWASLVFGAAIGLVLSVSGLSDGGLDSLTGDGPLPAGPALAVSAAYLAFIPIVGWLHLRSIDEHEAKANYEGALAGMYAYSMITPTWWICARAGLLPPVQPMTIFVIVMAIWGIVWVGRRNL